MSCKTDRYKKEDNGVFARVYTHARVVAPSRLCEHVGGNVSFQDTVYNFLHCINNTEMTKTSSELF